MPTEAPRVLMKKTGPLGKDEMIAVRRDIHAHPELGYKEARTAKVVQLHLKELGLKPRVMAGTGVSAVLDRGEGRTLMLRSDLDALPLTEDTGYPFASRNPGVMHACGHDLHTAILLGTAKNLVQSPPEKGKVKFNFQPAEEGLNGAGAMIDAGIMDDPRVDAVLGYHIWQQIPVGKIGVVTGPAMAAVDRFVVKLTGKGGHAAYPHQTRDPIVAAAHVVTALQTIVSRNLSAVDSGVVTVGRIESGTTFNIIPPTVEMEGTVRTFSKEAGRTIPRRFKEIVKGVAGALGMKAEIEYRRENIALVNDAAMSDFVREIARLVVGKRNVIDAEPSMGGEDHASYQALVPGCYAFIGSAPRGKAMNPHHHPQFNPSEDAMEVGAELMTRATRTWLARN